MRTQITWPLTVHGNGSIGQEIRDVDGRTIAWAVDAWFAQRICEYMNGRIANIENRAGKTDIAIHLFGLPDYELDQYELTGAGIREYAVGLGNWLTEVANIVEKLCDDGWRLKIVASNLEATHPAVNNCEEAVTRLMRLGIDMDSIIDIAEWGDSGERLTPA